MTKENLWKQRMKKQSTAHQSVKVGTTTRMHGYGMGVTFSSGRFEWNHSFSVSAGEMLFSTADFSK
jgi:hypothetical protein